MSAANKYVTHSRLTNQLLELRRSNLVQSLVTSKSSCYSTQRHHINIFDELDLVFEFKMEGCHSNLIEPQNELSSLPPPTEGEQANQSVPGGDRGSGIEFGEVSPPAFLSPAESSSSSSTASQSSGADDEISRSDLDEYYCNSCPSPDGERANGAAEVANGNCADAEIISHAYKVWGRGTSRSRLFRASRATKVRRQKNSRVKESFEVMMRPLSMTNKECCEEDSEVGTDNEDNNHEDSASESMIQELQETVAFLSQKMENLQEQNMEMTIQILHLATTNVQLLAANDGGNRVNSSDDDSPSSNTLLATARERPSGPSHTVVRLPAICQVHEIAHPQVLQLLSQCVKHPRCTASTPSDTEDDTSSAETPSSDVARASTLPTCSASENWSFAQTALCATKEHEVQVQGPSSNLREKVEQSNRDSSSALHSEETWQYKNA